VGREKGGQLEKKVGEALVTDSSPEEKVFQAGVTNQGVGTGVWNGGMITNKGREDISILHYKISRET